MANRLFENGQQMELTCFSHQLNEAAMAALEERSEFLENGTSSMSSSCSIELSHFERALSKVKPSVCEQVRAKC
jgi:SpoVK/Ycf46/Vps4 family AAA+-type ATPase